MTTRNNLASLALTFQGLALIACGAESGSAPTPTGTTADVIQCVTGWHGDIPYYPGPDLTVRACLTEVTCSDELNVVLDWEAVDPPPGPECTDRDAARAWAEAGGTIGHCRPRNPNIRGGFQEYDVFQMVASLFRNAGADQTVPMTLSVSLNYYPKFAATMGDGDRPALTVSADGRQTIMNAVSLVPYRVSSAEGTTCKGVQLNLDGSERSPTW